MRNRRPTSRDAKPIWRCVTSRRKARTFGLRVSAESLGSNFKELLETLGRTFTLPDAVGTFKVDALDIELELTAEGQIGLFGNGGKLGGKGSLTLRLKRP